MLKRMFNKMLASMSKRYDYDVSYMSDMVRYDSAAFIKFMMFQSLASHQGGVPKAPLYAAKLRAIIWDDCGPCTQLVVNLALEAKVSKDIVTAIIERNIENLPADVALVVEFTDLVLAHDPQADDLREKIVRLWGHKGLIAIGLAISSMRVYPAFKYALGYGNTCSKIKVEQVDLSPTRSIDVRAEGSFDG
ncbi:hypothetical protein [Thalassotalea ganghwensis]